VRRSGTPLRHPIEVVLYESRGLFKRMLDNRRAGATLVMET